MWNVFTLDDLETSIKVKVMDLMSLLLINGQCKLTLNTGSSGKLDVRFQHVLRILTLTNL